VKCVHVHLPVQLEPEHLEPEHLEPEHLPIRSGSSLTQLSHPISHGEDLMISSCPGKVLAVKATFANCPWINHVVIREVAA
jgi:hypothetical protein